MGRSSAGALQGGLLLFGLFGLGLSFLLAADRQKTFEELDAVVRPARATLVSTEVKKWLEARDHWGAFGTFDVVAGDFKGRAEGSLEPRDHRLGQAHNYMISRSEAEGFLPAWHVGRTYDAFWDPEHPDVVFFDKVDSKANKRMIFRIRLVSGLMFFAGLLLLVWPRRTRSTAATPSEHPRP
jgi:hypothetical protein